MWVAFSLGGGFFLLLTCTLLRGTIVNRTYGGHKNLCINLFLLTMLGPIYCRPP